MAVLYQSDHFPLLSPPTRKTARRCGSKINSSRTSVSPTEPGRAEPELAHTSCSDHMVEHWLAAYAVLYLT